MSALRIEPLLFVLALAGCSTASVEPSAIVFRPAWAMAPAASADPGVTPEDAGPGDGSVAAPDAWAPDAWSEPAHVPLFKDRDGDGHGDPTGTRGFGRLVPGWSATADDCDDDCVSCHPGGTEVCDADRRDEDCNGVANDGC